MATQWPLVDAVLVIGDGEPGRQVAEEADEHGKRVFTATLEPAREAAQALKGRKVMAFAGIGRPEKFFDTLHACGAIVDVTRAFPDHHPYKPDEVAALRREAEALGLLPVTTEKDLVRIPGATEAWPELMALPVRLRLENETGLRNLLLRRINERRLRIT
jgi:tetraacyldisaccharide 4'-kinase